MCRERFDWILDEKSWSYATQDACIAARRAFIAALGLKSDSVGWCKLELDDPRRETVFRAIADFCRDGQWSPRGVFSRTCAEEAPEWFTLRTTYFKDSSTGGYSPDLVPMVNGLTGQYKQLRAFHEPSPGPRYLPHMTESVVCPDTCVPERFRNACLSLGADAEFFWLRDAGKFRAEQYFALTAHPVPQIGLAWHLDTADASAMQALGGHLAQTAALCPRLRIHLPEAFLRRDLPAGGLAWAHRNALRSDEVALDIVLVHRDLAKALLERKALAPSALQPALVADELPEGYALYPTHTQHRPTAEAVARSITAYEAFRQVERPVRLVTEKEALTRLRAAKRQRKADFRRPLPKTAALTGPREALAAYYHVADGAILSDEYEWLSVASAEAAQTEYDDGMSREEVRIPGTVIARCADGDTVLLAAEGVLRVSHEVPEVIDQWPNVPQFLCDALEDGEL